MKYFVLFKWNDINPNYPCIQTFLVIWFWLHFTVLCTHSVRPGISPLCPLIFWDHRHSEFRHHVIIKYPHNDNDRSGHLVSGISIDSGHYVARLIWAGHWSWRIGGTPGLVTTPSPDQAEDTGTNIKQKWRWDLNVNEQRIQMCFPISICFAILRRPNIVTVKSTVIIIILNRKEVMERWVKEHEMRWVLLKSFSPVWYIYLTV